MSSDVMTQGGLLLGEGESHLVKLLEALFTAMLNNVGVVVKHVYYKPEHWIFLSASVLCSNSCWLPGMIQGPPPTMKNVL